MFNILDLINLHTSLNFMLMEYDFFDEDEDAFIELRRKVYSELNKIINGE